MSCNYTIIATVYQWCDFNVLEYPRKHVKLHQVLDYIAYLRCCIKFDCITKVWKEQRLEYFLFLSLDVEEIFFIGCRFLNFTQFMIKTPFRG